MKNSLKLLFIVFIAILFSCEKEVIEERPENLEVSQKVLDKIEALKLNYKDVTKKVVKDIDGSINDYYFIEGDIAMTYDQIMDMKIHNDEGVSARQYHTYNLVSTPRVIRVVGYNGNNSFGLGSVARRGLQYAVANYNNINLGFRLELVFSTNFSSNDIVVYTQTNSSVIPQDGVRGSAGFPSGGEPFKRVMINGGANRNGDDQLLEGLMTHELGHCFGLRHVDWFSRESCGQSGEPVNPEGAIHIPGTPTGRDPGSIMNACFPHNNGEFGQYDIVALQYLY
ncbi:M57 family metalloprotease [Tenacibaculum sp. ZS6-P6]|uniref:M57 family metalloprotease n=1 Tax=Tenacibaculum sp. ZS6-P6 TaxID=3447503 RepID=UPI003F992BDD